MYWFKILYLIEIYKVLIVLLSQDEGKNKILKIKLSR